jgi:putative ATP-binding cassette transporter
LLHLKELVLKPGNKVLLQGPSGSGKSTFFRTLAGLWPYKEGQINLPANTVFVPQRPYLPTGTLRAALAYPQAAGDYSTEVLLNALKQAELGPNKGNWQQRLDEEANWGQQLSIGEQQRVSLARVFLQKPFFLFLDEATSALDISTEEVIYARLLALLNQQQGSLVSVAHRQTLDRFHQQRWQLEKNTLDSNPAFENCIDDQPN